MPKEVRLNRVINRDKYIGNSEDIKSKYERRYFPAEDKYNEEYWVKYNIPEKESILYEAEWCKLQIEL